MFDLLPSNTVVCVCINNKSDSPGSAVWGGRWGLPVLGSSPNCLTTGSSDHRVMTAYDCQNTCQWLAALALACAEAQFSLSFLFCHLPLCFLHLPWVWLTPAECGRRNIRRWELTQCVCGRSRTRCHMFWLVCVYVCEETGNSMGTCQPRSRDRSVWDSFQIELDLPLQLQRATREHDWQLALWLLFFKGCQ